MPQLPFTHKKKINSALHNFAQPETFHSSNSAKNLIFCAEKN